MEMILDAAVTLHGSREEYFPRKDEVLDLTQDLDLKYGGKAVTPEIERVSSAFYQGFLRGLFHAIGTVEVPQERRITIQDPQEYPEYLEAVQRMLIRIGIASRIHPAQPLHQHASQTQRELVIANENIDRFASFTGGGQQARLDHPLGHHNQLNTERFTATVESVEPDGPGVEEVFDVQVPGSNAFDANGLYVHNCGEQPLSPYESCNLGSINLARMVRYTSSGAEIDWKKLEKVIRTGVHMLDNVIDMNEYPLPEIEQASRLSRRIGLGVMGWADLLIQLGIRYDSQEALDLADSIMRFIRNETHRASGELAKTRGPYPAWEGSIYEKNRGEPILMRNTAPVTIAPTGTISIIAGASSGIEPLFALAYNRNIMDRTRMQELNPYFDAVAMQEGINTPELMEQIALTGSLEQTGAPDWMREVFRVAQDIAPEWHVRMQAAFQAHTDNSVSKTINFPHSATQDDVERAYMLAYETGCKGITVYRDGSKPEQVLSTGQTGQAAQTNGRRPAPRPRPRRMAGMTSLVRTGHGNMYTTINYDQDGKPFEVFTTVGKAGGCDSAQIEAISRLISLGLRSGIEPEEITRQLRGITCCPKWDEGIQVRSIPDGVALALENRLGHRGQPRQGAATTPGSAQPCPECSAPISFQEGCEACTNLHCGWNRCN